MLLSMNILSAYHVLQCTEAAGVNSFQESANTVAIIRYQLNVINQAVQHTNLGQATVVTADKPL